MFVQAIKELASARVGSYFIKHNNILHDINVYFKLSVTNEFLCVFCSFSVSCYCIGDIMIDKVWGESRVRCWEWKQPTPRSGWCMLRWLGHCVTRGRFQWDFLINQTNCKLLIRYNSSLTPQTLAHRYERAILRINKNNKCIMLALLFIIASWKLIFSLEMFEI